MRDISLTKKERKKERKKMGANAHEDIPIYMKIIWYDTCWKWVILSIFQTIFTGIVALGVRIIIHQLKLRTYVNMVIFNNEFHFLCVAFWKITDGMT